MRLRSILLVLALMAAPVLLLAQWDAEDSNTKASLRGIHRAGPGVAWASGTGGVILRSEDDGYLWQQCAAVEASPGDAAKLDFRGVWAWDANHAIAMSSGPGKESRVYETLDGCAHWRLLSVNTDPEGFWDAIAFWNEHEGVLLGDPVKGRFVILRTSDGGKHWRRDDAPRLEADPRGEGAFAASNSALALGMDGKSIYFATGGEGGARVFRFARDGGSGSGHWSAARLPFTHRGEGAGVFSLAFRDGRHGVAVGGDYTHAGQREDTAAWTEDGGATWRRASEMPAGYRSAVEWDAELRAWIAVGPNGSDVSFDDGATWKAFDGSGWNALSLPWAVGAAGKIARLGGAASAHDH
ncbi:MAG: hypothetical protein JO340_01170 [Acidobacteriaceae bacterium]|nr:hypothetical protein [Acidobacteriaceae bacterium]